MTEINPRVAGARSATNPVGPGVAWSQAVEAKRGSSRLGGHFARNGWDGEQGDCDAREPVHSTTTLEQPVQLRIPEQFHRIAHTQLLPDQRLVVRHRLGTQVQALGDGVQRIAGHQALQHLELAW